MSQIVFHLRLQPLFWYVCFLPFFPNFFIFQVCTSGVPIGELIGWSLSCVPGTNLERREQSVCRRTHVQFKPRRDHDGKYGKLCGTGKGDIPNLITHVYQKVARTNEAYIHSQLNVISRWYKPWFFKHVESFWGQDPHVEYIPTRDYFHRHSRSIFWEIQVHLLQLWFQISYLHFTTGLIKDIIPFGNHPVFRYLFGWMVPPKVSLLKLTQGETVKELYENNHFIQDMLVPITTLKDALRCFEKEVKVLLENIALFNVLCWRCIFSLSVRFIPYGCVLSNCQWRLVCCAQPTASKICMLILAHMEYLKWIISTQLRQPDVLRALCEVSMGIENIFLCFLLFLVLPTFCFTHSFQMLYADSYMTEEEFHSMFDHTLYNQMRKKYDCDEAFPRVYGKVSRSARD